MPAPGLSLVGFLDRDEALSHLKNFSVPRDNSEDALIREWMVAKSKIGQPVSRAGLPDIRPIEPPLDGYIRDLCEKRWVQTVLNRPEYKSAEFKLVEIGPLLAHQPLVHTERPDKIYGNRKAVMLSDLMSICLPSTQPRPLDLPTVLVKDWHSVVIKGRDLQIDRITPAVMPMQVDEYEQAFVGMQIWWGLPFVHAVRFNGLCYLINGYHRVIGAGARGATHVPCLLRDAEQSSWLLMPRRLFESSNPPTLGHFLKGRAYPVALRATSRILAVSWSERLMPDEYEGI